MHMVSQSLHQENYYKNTICIQGLNPNRNKYYHKKSLNTIMKKSMFIKYTSRQTITTLFVIIFNIVFICILYSIESFLTVSFFFK